MKKLLYMVLMLTFTELYNIDKSAMDDRSQELINHEAAEHLTRQDNRAIDDNSLQNSVHHKKHEHVINQDNSELYAEVVAADATFAATYTAQPDMLAKKKAIVLTCMDPRLMPDEFMGFHAGDMYVVRNAGGRASDDALRSIIIAHKLLGAEEIFVVQHTDCGMQKFTNDVMNDLLKTTLATAKLVKDCNENLEPVQKNKTCKWKNIGKCCGKKPCNDYKCINWMTIRHGLFDSVLKDVKAIRKHHLIPLYVPIYGFIFDVTTGELIPVPKAMKAGKAKRLSCKK